jgi:high-affinity Fe2+/Pb2+ permease
VSSSPPSWLHRLLSAAIGLAVAAWLVSWSWALLRPLLPVLAVAAVVGLIGYGVVRHYRRF